MAQLKRYNGASWDIVGGAVTGDTLPIGSEIDYDGETAPVGWEEIEDYSTTAINTGKKWIDGKDIYRQVISTSNAQCQTPGVSVDKSVSASSLNISEVIDLKFRVETDLFAGFYNVFGGNDPTNNTRCYYDKVNKNIVIRNGNTGYNSATITMIIEYTKVS